MLSELLRVIAEQRVVKRVAQLREVGLPLLLRLEPLAHLQSLIYPVHQPVRC